MSKFRTSILIVGMLVIIVAASLLTVFALYITGSVVTDKIELIYSVFDEEKVYDGTPLVPERYQLVSGELLKDHHAVVDFEGSQTDAGESKGSLTVKICDKNGYDVTSEYKIGVIRGKLRVLQREIEVVLEDQEVTYNGTKVSFEDYTVTYGELIAGHKIAGSQNAQLITVNDTLPTDLKPIVYDLVGKDVTNNYNVHFTMGRIRVLPRPVKVKPVSVTKVYDGKEVALGDVEIYEGSLAEGQYFKTVEINNGLTTIDPGVCNRVTRITKLAIYQGQGSLATDVTENYDIDLSETGVVRIDKRPLTVTAKSRTWVYDGSQHDLTGDHSALSYEGLAPGELLVSVDYSGDITDAGEETNYISGIHLSDNASVDNYEIMYVNGTLTVTKRNITIITPTVSREYDGTALKGSDGGLPTSVNLLPEHMIVPDEDNMPELTECGTISNLFACRIVNKEGIAKTDFTENYNITYYYGDLTVEKRVLRVITPTISEPFDGEVHYGYESGDEIETDNLLQGHEIVVPQGAARPSRVDVGISYNSFKVTVHNAEGVDVTQNYNIDYSYGNIEITRLTVTVSTGEMSKEYDGNELKMGEDMTRFGDLPAGLKAELIEGQSYPAITDVSKTRNEVLYKLTKGGEDVDEKNYKIVYDYGWLEITPCAVRIRLKNISKEYDGNEIVITVADALEGVTLPASLNADSFVVTATADEIKDAGTYSYTLELKENNPNYELNITDGNITVNKFKINMELPEWREGITEEYSYDGASHLPIQQAAISEKYLFGGLLSYNDYRIIPVSGDFVNASYNVYSYTAQIVSEKAKNFDLTCTGGTLKIIKCNVAVDLEPYTVTYTGNVFIPDIKDAYINTSNGLVKANPEQYFELYTNGTIKDAGEYTYGVKFIYGEYSNNFNLTVTNDGGMGKVTVNKLSVNVTSYVGTLSKTYDGNVFALDKDYVNVSATLDTDVEFDYSVNCVTDSANVGDNYRLTVDKNSLYFYVYGENVTRNFEVTNSVTITVAITPRAITFALKNYECASGSAPRYVTQEIKECLYVSGATPLLNGYSISFDDDVINYSYNNGTLIVEDFDEIRIFNEKGEDVTGNFYVTNEDRLTASVIER